MREIHIIDTSVFCEVLNIPGMCSRHEEAFIELEELIAKSAVLLLPLATIYETGNHIAQNGSGNQRRKVASIFAKSVIDAFNGNAPWTPTPMHSAEEVAGWLADFDSYAERGIGVGDLSIIRTFDEQCLLHPSARVKIWSYDQHLSSYDRTP